jgi:3-phenylpropionate/cinnamic acid dioxygenase small subunit
MAQIHDRLKEHAMNTPLLNQVVAFLWEESDMLDNELYAEWLQLWHQDGRYIVPIDPKETDFANTLNYANDDAQMRAMRVRRLTGGESISTSPEPRTIRLNSRYRILEDDGQRITVRCAQFLTDFRKENARQYVANLSYQLQRHGDSFLIVQKVVRLINSDDVLQTIGYIL